MTVTLIPTTISIPNGVVETYITKPMPVHNMVEVCCLCSHLLQEEDLVSFFALN